MFRYNYAIKQTHTLCLDFWLGVRLILVSNSKGFEETLVPLVWMYVLPGEVHRVPLTLTLRTFLKVHDIHISM